MKKTTLIFLFSLCCFFGYAQLQEETFEGTAFPPAGWGVYDNGIGTFYSWQKSAPGNIEQPPYLGTAAAFVERENVSTGLPEDWLVTKQFLVPLNGKITFYSRLSVVGDQGGIYQLKVSTGTNQSALADYTLMQQWTESQINGVQQRDYVKKELNFDPTLYGQMVYVAFIMKGDFADRWLIDNVSVTENCPNPANLTAENFTTTSAQLSWDNPSGATQWEVEIVGAQAPATGVGQIYTGTLPYTPTLLEGTEYKYYVKAICPLGGQSDWIGPHIFKTNRKGDLCSDPIVVNTLPFSRADDTDNAANYYTGTPGTGCGNTVDWGQYIEGNDVIYSYTPAQNETITIKAAQLYNDNAAIFVYTSCDDIGTNCVAANFNEYSLNDLSIPFFNVTAGTTYYILFSTSFGTTPYFFTIQKENCAVPNQLAASSITTTGATLTWAETGTATAWQYAMVAAGTGLPQGSGTATTGLTYSPTGLPPGTQYEFYVRSNCGDGTYSSWAGPLYFNTQCNPLSTPFHETFNSDSVSEYCWTIADLNNDGRKWNLSNTNSPSEGNQSATFFTDFSADNDDMLISPALLMQPNHRVRYRYKVEPFSATHFKVMLSTTGTNPANFTTELLPLVAYENGEYKTKILDLSAYAGQTIHLAWHVPPGNPNSNMVYLDDVFVEPWPACAEPTELNANTITSTTAKLFWDNGHNETAWEIGIKDLSQGTLPPAQGDVLIPVSTNPYTAQNLVPNTTYTYYVRAVCGSNIVSQWVGPYQFTTACVALPVPFFEGFNSNSTTQNCWSIINSNNDWSIWNLDSGYPQAFEGDESASIFAGINNINDWLVSPALILTGNERLKYHYAVGEGGAKFRVMLSTTGKDASDFTEILVPSTVYDNTGGNGGFLKQIVSLAGYTGPVYIAFHANPPSGGYATINIDNFIVEPIPACPEPGDLAVGTLTQTSAQVSWLPGGTETQWEIFVQEPGAGTPTGAGTPATSPYTITALANGQPLTAGSTYEVYVRAICAPGSQSIWSDKLTFVTMISNDECADAINIPVNTGAECILQRWGTTIGATVSPEAQCDEWSVYEDVWFEFVAQAEVHTLNFGNLPDSQTLEFAIYEGDCGTLTPLLCPGSTSAGPTTVLRNLTIGQTYKIRVLKWDFMQGVSFSICIKTPATSIAVSTSQYTPEQLIRELLIGSECAQISNITYSTGSDFGGPNGIGSFTKNGANFPFESGIIMSSGDVLDAPGPNQDIAGTGGEVPEWIGDTELEQIIEAGTGIPMDSHNASILEFDFVPLIDTMTFDFMFASEEYGLQQCFYSDSFAFILTDAQNNKSNLAVLPDTQIPVSVITIRDEAYNDFCDSQNPQYFDMYNGEINGINFGDNSPTNYNGQTVLLQAKANVIPGNAYHIKMVIADKGDDVLDSAVFLGAGSFDIGEMDLGVDLLIATNNAVCVNSETILNSHLDAEAFIIKWLKDNVEIPGQTGSTLIVTEPGMYTIDAKLIGSLCNVNDSITVEFYPDVASATRTPQNLIACNDSGIATFNLELNTSAILNDVASDVEYTVTYHANTEDSETGDNALAFSYDNIASPQTIYARIVQANNPCYTVKTFTLTVDALPDFDFAGNFTVCNGTNAVIEVVASNFDDTVATYTWTKDGVAITNTTKIIEVAEPGVYEVTVTNGVCSSANSVTVAVLPAPVADSPLDAEACDSYVLPALSAGNRYFTATGGDNGTGTEILDTTIKTTQTIYVYALSNTTPACSAENSFVVTINPTPQFNLEGTYSVCLPENAVITVNPTNFDGTQATYQWTLNGSPTGTDNSSITPTAFGKYGVTVTVGDCFTTQFVDVTLNTDAIALAITDDCETGFYTVEVSDKDGSFNIDNATFTWTGPGDFTSTERVIKPEKIGIYNVTVVTEDGCITKDSYPVTSTTCDIPRGVSPNNDDKNDTFNLSSLEVKKLGIFNRYGQEVYTKANYTDDWHGQGSNGDELPTGTYFYMIERANGETRTGWVYLNREE